MKGESGQMAAPNTYEVKQNGRNSPVQKTTMSNGGQDE